MPRYEIDQRALEDSPVELQRKAQKIIEKAVQAARENPLSRFTPYKQQAQFLAAHTERLRAFFGGNRAGKSTTGVVASVLAVAPEELIPEHLLRFKPPECMCPQYGRIVVPSTKLINNQMSEIVRQWVPRTLLKNGRWGDSYSKYEYMLRLECGCFIELMSYEMDRDKFGGSPRHWVLYDEEPPIDIREECRARLTDWNGFEMFAMTPLNGMTWMFDDVWLAAGADPDIFAVVAAMIDNPNISEEGVLASIKAWQAWPEQLAARVYGRFVHFGGMVYPDWRKWRCPRPSDDWLKHQRTVVGIDPGARNFGLGFMAIDKAGNQVLWQTHLIAGEMSKVPHLEYHPEGANVDHAVAAIKRILAARGIDWQRVDYVMDPSARARSPIVAETVESAFIAQGIFPDRGQNDVEAGILSVRSRGANGTFRFSESDCDGFEWEAERYRIDEDRADGQFRVIKEKDHIMDAVRYASMTDPYVVEVDPRERPLGPDVAHPPPRPSRPVGPLGRFA